MRADQFTDELDRASVFPRAFLGRVQPDKVGITLDEALDPDAAGFLVPMLDRAAGIGDLVGAHRGIANDDDFVLRGVLVQHVPGIDPVIHPAAVILPEAFIGAVVEVVVFEVLYLGFCGGEQLLHDPHKGVHRAADIQQQQHGDGVALLGAHLDVEIALAGGVADRLVKVQFVLRALAGPFAQALHGDLDVPCTELDLVVVVLELALVPDFHGAAVAGLVLADAYAFGIVAIRSKRRSSAGADHLVAAFVALLLLFEALFQRFHQLLEAAHGLDFGHLLGGQEFLAHLLEPFLGQVLDVDRVGQRVEAFEDVGEDAVELVDVALVFHQGGAGEVVEVLDIHLDDLLVHRLHEGQVFLQCHRDFRGA